MIAVYYNWGRWFDPATGRYLQGDPKAISPFAALAHAYGGQATAVYGYADGNPLSNTDPTGFDILPNWGDPNLSRGIQRMLNSPRARELWDYLNNERPEKIPLTSEAAFWNKAEGQWQYGHTTPISRDRYNKQHLACFADTDPTNEGTSADPALNVAHELAHAQGELICPSCSYDWQESYAKGIEGQIERELRGRGIVQ